MHFFFILIFEFLSEGEKSQKSKFNEMVNIDIIREDNYYLMLIIVRKAKSVRESKIAVELIIRYSGKYSKVLYRIAAKMSSNLVI